MRVLWVIIFSCFFSGLSAQTSTQSQPAYWLVQRVYVKANATQAYEQNIKQLIYSLQVQNDGCSPFNWYTFVTPDQALYTYVTPVLDFNHLQAIYQAMSEESSILCKLHQSLADEINSFDVSFLMPMNNLSYHPSTNPCVQPYNIIENLEVVPGQESNFEALVQGWQNSGSLPSSGYTVFVSVIGPNQPQYSIVYNGASYESFKSQFSQLSQLGARQQMMNGDSFGVLRAYSWTSNVYAPELSNVNMPSRRRGFVQKVGTY